MKSTGNHGFIRRACICLASLAATFSLCVAQADDVPADPVRTFNIAAQPLSKALLEFSKQSGLIVTVPSSLVEGKVAPEIHGALPSSQALEKLLSGSGLKASRTPSGGITIGNSTTSGQGHTSSSTSQVGSQTAGSQAARSSDSTQSAASSGSRTESDKTNDHLTEIIVTAQKKSERLQDVPVPVGAINADTLVNSNQLRLQDYYTSIPGLTVAPAAFSGQILAIRGVTTGNGNNPTVGITIDDAPFGAATNIGGGSVVPDIDPGDLSRIEVLRGPQGTLYGASSMGGLIKFVTVDPSFDGISGRLQAGMSGVFKGAEPGYNFRASVNLPLSDSFAIRASAFTRQDPGYIDNPILHLNGVNEEHANGGRLAALWRPSDVFSVKLSALYQQIKGDGSNDVDLGPGLGDLQQNRMLGTGWYERKVQAYSATISAKLGEVELTSISGFNINSFEDSLDASFGLGSFAQEHFGVTGAPLITENSTRKFTQEIRLTGPIGPMVDWLAGAFYTHENSPNAQIDQAADATTGQVVGQGLYLSSPSKYEEYAAFADLTVHFTDRFDVQLGGRESEIKQSSAESNVGLYTEDFYLQPSPVNFPQVDAKHNAFTYLVTPRYRLSPDLMVYARLASGYRAGGTNVAPGVPREYSPDKTQNYELGLKGDFLDHTLTIDSSVYYISWKDIQLSLLDPQSFQYYNGNASRAKSEGVEFSMESKPLAGLTIGAWVEYNNAVLTESFPSSVPGYSTFGVPGDRLPYSSRFSGKVSLEQDFRLTGRVSGFVGGAVSVVGDRKGEFTTTADRQDLPFYAKTDLSAGAKYDTWTISLFVNNVTDRRGLLAGGTGYFPPFGYSYIQPRTGGLTVAKTF